MKYEWQDLPKPLNCFTVQNTATINLNTKKIVQHYSTNTKIVVVQKCVTEEGTYYRTASAEHHYLNHAFKAVALGLPNEIAPPVHSPRETSRNTSNSESNKSGSRTLSQTKKQTSTKKACPSKGGEMGRLMMKVRRMFRRVHG